MGFLEKKITLYSHTGTYMDAPCHIIPGAKTLDQMPADHFVGKGAVIELEVHDDAASEDRKGGWIPGEGCCVSQ